ncbi:trypsin-like peptidase domain-containing protein [Mycobacterium sp.]|uniref:trypsin-like peptidase domain-containing protein n=1 Tax=Mycobacterium sp. TaxID=1785 RepID=UPI003F9B49D6
MNTPPVEVAAPVRHPLFACLLRVRTSDGEVVGAAFLAADRVVCTCAHVVAQALGISEQAEQAPAEPVRLEFYIDDTVARATVTTWMPVRGDDSATGEPEDIALLTLDEPAVLPAGVWPARLPTPGRLAGHPFTVCGFAEGSVAGVWANGVLEERRANGTVQIESPGSTGVRVQPGFSGAPVWDDRERGVIGMVVSSWRDKPTRVAFLIPVDQLAAAANGLLTLAQPSAGPFAVLTGGVATAGRGLAQFLRYYIGDSKNPAAFGGRQESLDELDRWLADSETSNLLVTAPAGRGKSALLAHWALEVAETGRADVVLAPISLRFGTNLRHAALALIVERLRSLLPEAANITETDLPALLAEGRRAGTWPLLVVVDGVDEASGWQPERDLPLPVFPAENVKIVVSARLLVDRDAEGWIEALQWHGTASRFELPPLDREGVAEVLRSVTAAEEWTPAEKVADTLQEATEGDPLLVRLFVDAIGPQGFIDPGRLPELIAGGLANYFNIWWGAQRQAWKDEGRDPELETEFADAIFGVIATVLGPVGRDDLAQLTGMASGAKLDGRLRELRRWIITTGAIGDERSYAFAHPRLRDFWRGTMMTEAQRAALDRRLIEFCRDEFERLVADTDAGTISPYVLRYYGAHLEQPGAPAGELPKLVCPAWWRAREALEHSQEGFFQDVLRAWRLAERDVAGLVRDRGLPVPAEVPSACIRYALVASSLSSLSGNLLTELLVQLVSAGVWPYVSGLAEVRLDPNPRSRSRGIAALAALGEDEDERFALLGEALEAALQLPPDYKRMEALQHLAPVLPPVLLARAAADARTILDPSWRARVLVVIGKCMRGRPQEEILGAALEAAAKAHGFFEPASSLAEVVGASTGELRTRTLEAAVRAARAEPVDTQNRSRELTMIAEKTEGAERDRLLEEALDAALAIPVSGTNEPDGSGVRWSSDRKTALGQLAPLLSGGLLQRALAEVQRFGDSSDADEVIAALAPQVAVEDPRKAIALCRLLDPFSEGAKALEQVAGRLCDQALLDEVVSAATTPEQTSDSVLAAVAVRKVETGAVEAGLELARSLRGIWKAEALARIARAVDDPLQSSLVPEVITASADEQAASWLARHLELIDDTESPVLGLAVALADQGKPEVALDVTRAVPMRHGDGRPASGVLTLSRLAPHLPQPLARQALRDAVEATRAVGDVPDRIRALVQLAESLSPDEQRALAPCFDRALGEIDNITDENQRVRALADILPHLTPPQLERALELARKAARADLEVRLLTAVAPFLESPARDRVVAEADELAVNVRWGQTNSSTLARLISLLNLDRQRQWIEEVKQGELRGFVSGVCSSVSSELVPELLQVVLDSDDGPIRQQGLTGLAPRLGPRDAQRALAAIIELPETNGARVDALAAIAPALPSSSLDTALEAIRDLDREENEYSYGNASGALAHRLASDGRIDEALQLVAFIVDKDDWAQAVIDVTQTIPQSDRADLMRGTIAQFELAEDPVVIAILTAALPEPERGESAVRVFEASRTAEDPDQQARLVELAAPWLPPEYLGEAVELVRTLDTMGYIYQRSRAKALRSLAPRLASLEPATFTTLCQTTLRVSATRARDEVLWDLPALAPAFEAMAGPALIRDAALEIGTVTKWWP